MGAKIDIKKLQEAVDAKKAEANTALIDEAKKLGIDTDLYSTEEKVVKKPVEEPKKPVEVKPGSSVEENKNPKEVKPSEEKFDPKAFMEEFTTSMKDAVKEITTVKEETKEKTLVKI